jgi:hypothetical protein
MLLRAENIPFADTIHYKIHPLAVLRATLDAHLEDRPIVFVDDYLHLIKELNLSGINVTGVHFDAHTSWSAIARDHLRIENL